MRKMVKFKELTKQQKIFRIVNLSIMLAIFLASVGLMIYYKLTEDPDKRFSASLVIAVVCIIPFVLETIFRFRFNNVIFLVYEIYVIVAGLFGSALNGYKLISWFDTPVHILMGYIMALAGLFVIARLGQYKKLNPWLVAVFCLCFSLGIELVWEIFEWISDRLTGSTMQGDVLEQFGQPLLWDTVKDLICNFSGAMIFFLHFLLGKFTKLNLGIPAMETELTTRKLVRKDGEITEHVELKETEDISESKNTNEEK